MALYTLTIQDTKIYRNITVRMLFVGGKVGRHSKPRRKKIILRQGEVTKLSPEALEELQAQSNDEWFEKQKANKEQEDK